MKSSQVKCPEVAGALFGVQKDPADQESRQNKKKVDPISAEANPSQERGPKSTLRDRYYGHIVIEDDTKYCNSAQTVQLGHPRLACMERFAGLERMKCGGWLHR